MKAKSSLTRLGIAIIVIGAALAILWQGGVIFSSPNAPASDARPDLKSANTQIETPLLAGQHVGLAEGDVAPDFEFSGFDGQRLRLSDFRGKAVFINFWATWCNPCRTEMPDMDALLGGYADRGLVILSVNNGDSFKRADSFVKDLGVQFTAFAYDPETSIANRYGVYGLPTSFFIDAEGLITRVALGQMSYASMETAANEALAGYNRTR